MRKSYVRRDIQEFMRKLLLIWTSDYKHFQKRKLYQDEFVLRLSERSFRKNLGEKKGTKS